MNKPKVSVIVPVYNVEKYLKRCVDSIINQTLIDIEIILVNDGSTDTSGELCDKVALLDKRIKVIHKKNEGLGLARNSGMDIALGEYIGFVDSDDFIEKDMFEILYKSISKENAQMAISGYKTYRTFDKNIVEHKLPNLKRLYEGDEIKEILFGVLGARINYKNDYYLGMSVWKNLYSLDFIKKKNIKFVSEREYISEDAIFHLSIIPKMKKIVTVDKTLYYYCNNDEVTLTSRFRKDRFTRYKELYLKEAEILNSNNLIEEGKNIIGRTFLGNTRTFIKQIIASEETLYKKIQLIKEICNDELLQKIILIYPYKNARFKQRVYFMALKYKLVSILFIIVKAQCILDKFK